MRCCRLDEDGKRCKSKATGYTTMHMGVDLYGCEPNWCVVPCCKRHCEKTRYKIDEKEDNPVDDKRELDKEKKE